MSLFDGDSDWYCVNCHTHLNDQIGFNVLSGSWTCSECGYENNVSDDSTIPGGESKGYISETVYDDGTVEKVRYTKTREVHDFDGANGKMSFWRKRR